MKYTPKYFRDNLPKAKNKRSSFLVRNFYRKVSFPLSSLAYMCGLTANQVSFIGLILAFLSTLLLLIPNKACNIIAVVVCALWMISDCVDGNLARCVGKQPFGEFIDACGSYTIVVLMLPAAGLVAYRDASIFFNQNPWIIILGAFGGISDCLTRLYYQKYKNEALAFEEDERKEIDGAEKGTIQKLYDIYMRLSKEIGLQGIYFPLLLFSIIFNFVDIFVIFYFLFYGANYLASLILLLKQTNCLKKPENYGRN